MNPKLGISAFDSNRFDCQLRARRTGITAQSWFQTVLNLTNSF
jgi:hypothetical protein